MKAILLTIIMSIFGYYNLNAQTTPRKAKKDTVYHNKSKSDSIKYRNDSIRRSKSPSDTTNRRPKSYSPNNGKISNPPKK
jgi:hypothetical protein